MLHPIQLVLWQSVRCSLMDTRCRSPVLGSVRTCRSWDGPYTLMALCSGPRVRPATWWCLQTRWPEGWWSCVAIFARWGVRGGECGSRPACAGWLYVIDFDGWTDEWWP